MREPNPQPFCPVAWHTVVRPDLRVGGRWAGSLPPPGLKRSGSAPNRTGMPESLSPAQVGRPLRDVMLEFSSPADKMEDIHGNMGVEDGFKNPCCGGQQPR